MKPTVKEVIEKNPDPGILKNPSSNSRWPYIGYRTGEPYEFAEEQTSFQPFNLLGCAIQFLRLSTALFAVTLGVTILLVIAQILSLFGIVEPMW